MCMSDVNTCAFSSIASPALFGKNNTPGLVSCGLDECGNMRTWWRCGDDVEMRLEKFKPFLWLSDLDLLREFEYPTEIEELEGGQPFRHLVRVNDSDILNSLSRHIVSKTGVYVNAISSAQICVSDPVCQYLMERGYTYYKGMRWEDLHQIWMVPLCEGRPPFHLSEELQKPLLAVIFLDEQGRVYILRRLDYNDEKVFLQGVLDKIQELNPDVINGYRLYDDILPYLAARCKKYRIPMALGREGFVPISRKVRQKIAERSVDYRRWDVLGREFIDTWLLAQLYDITAREMDSYELDDVAAFLCGESSLDKLQEALDKCVLSETDPVSEEYLEALGEYARQQVLLEARLSAILAQSYFMQAQIFPYSYQNTIIRGNAMRINSLFLREYLRVRRALPQRAEARAFSGGLTEQEHCGLAHEVYHCDVQSLYPSVMLHWRIKPSGDELGIFLSMLETLRSFRLQAKQKARNSKECEYSYWQALQTTFKVLINSFFGYLGFEQGNFSDYEAAAQVTARGRDVLQAMIAWLKDKNCAIIEVDTDGIFFTTPPEMTDVSARQKLIADLNASLPDTINLEIDGHYRAMYCHKKKNYALLDYEDNLILRGSALRARNIEPFFRNILTQTLDMILRDRSRDIPALFEQASADLRASRVPLAQLAKTESLMISLDNYKKKIDEGGRKRRAVYEVALLCGNRYKTGDKVTFYITGDKANVRLWQNAKLLSAGDEANYDANIDYYLDKLNELRKKVCLME